MPSSPAVLSFIERRFEIGTTPSCRVMWTRSDLEVRCVHGQDFRIDIVASSNAVAKKRSIALNMLLSVRTVPGDFKGASWRRKSGPDQQFDSALEDAFKKRKTSGATWPFTMVEVLEELQANGLTDVCGIVQSHESQSEWLIRKTWQHSRSIGR